MSETSLNSIEPVSGQQSKLWLASNAWKLCILGYLVDVILQRVEKIQDHVIFVTEEISDTCWILVLQVLDNIKIQQFSTEHLQGNLKCSVNFTLFNLYFRKKYVSIKTEWLDGILKLKKDIVLHPRKSEELFNLPQSCWGSAYRLCKFHSDRNWCDLTFCTPFATRRSGT